MKKFNLISPTDFRYSVGDLEPYLSEEGFIAYKSKVEAALAKTLAKYGLCSEDIGKEIEKASKKIRAEKVYEEEKRIGHDIRAQVNKIKEKISDGAKPFVHATATSYDIVDTANSLRYRDAIKKVIIPDMVELEKTFMDLAEQEKNTVKIGRTHGQHAIPITFGFEMAQYVDRWGERILKLKEACDNLVGKFSGAVGAFNASSLLIENPEKFEQDLLSELGLKPARISRQIVPPEPMTDFIHCIISSFGVLANYADDMRHLQRTEIGEVGEPFGKEQVGSSTMPQKKNPINFENIKSVWKKFMPSMVTMYIDQISEHQRDLTNSASQRWTPEILVGFDSSVRRMKRISKKLTVDRENIRKNLETSRDKIVAEPLQILLSYYGHEDAHEAVRKLSMESYKTKKPLTEIVFADKQLKPYLDKFTSQQLEILSNPEKYTGRAPEVVEKVNKYWEFTFKKNNLW